MNILIVGAGAVGQVYGFYLQQGGAAVDFLVKSKYRAQMESGCVLYPLNRSKRQRWHPVYWQDYNVLDQISEVAHKTYDYIILTIPGNAITEKWLHEFSPHIGEANIVALQATSYTRAKLQTLVSSSRYMAGMIALIAYATPLEDETTNPPGIAWYLPPVRSFPFWGQQETVKPLVKVMKKGGAGAGQIKDMPSWKTDSMSAMLMAILAAWEKHDWNWYALVRSEDWKTALSAANELRQVARTRGGKKSFNIPLLGPMIRVAGAIARCVLPFDFDMYMRTHFTKVGEQTRMILDAYIGYGTDLGIATPNAQSLRESIK